MAMEIRNNRLFVDGAPVRFVTTPNQGGLIDLKYLVMHYTAGRNLESSVSWLANPQASASAHLVIGRDGTIVQMVDFNRKAFHAGQSTWRGLVGLNQFSIGIELDNAGVLKQEGGQWTTAWGQTIPAADVMEARHKHDTLVRGWHTYPTIQLDVAAEAAATLIRHYNLSEVIGHEDCSPRRKTDPGPAFPMDSFRAKVMGRDDDSGFVFATTTTLNIRSGPGTEFATIPGSPLPPGTRVLQLDEQGVWWKVDTLDPVNGVNDVVGWVHSRHLTMVTDAAAGAVAGGGR